MAIRSQANRPRGTSETGRSSLSGTLETPSHGSRHPKPTGRGAGAQRSRPRRTLARMRRFSTPAVIVLALVLATPATARARILLNRGVEPARIGMTAKQVRAKQWLKFDVQ